MSQFYKIIAENARRNPSQEAIIEGETRWTYRDFLEQIEHLASGFKARNVNPGDRVGLMLYNQKEILACLFALRKIGAVVVPINIQMLPQDIGFSLQNSGVRQLVVADSLYSGISHLPLETILVGEAVEGRPNLEELSASGESLEEVPIVKSLYTDLALLLYTSGTTGYPKGVMLSEKNILANIAGFEGVVNFSEADRLVVALPLFHSYGLTVALTGLTAGASLTLIPKFHPKQIVEALVRERATILPLVPTLYSVILDLIDRQGGIDLPHLRFCVSGGASLPVQLLKRIETTLKTTVIEGYGLTETSPVLTVNDPKVGSIPGSVGKQLFNVQLRIVREDGTECAVGEIGEIQVRGDNVMTGYYNLPEETQAAFTPDGWFRTGDLGHLDSENRLYISGGRKKDIIIRAGENISPVSIEEVLYRHEAVREAAVVGMPHERLGEEVVACISLKEGHAVTAQEIIRFCREHLPPSYVPGTVEFFDELPKTPIGKIAKKLLKETLAKRTATARKH